MAGVGGEEGGDTLDRAVTAVPGKTRQWQSSGGTTDKGQKKRYGCMKALNRVLYYCPSPLSQVTVRSKNPISPILTSSTRKNSVALGGITHRGLVRSLTPDADWRV